MTMFRECGQKLSSPQHRLSSERLRHVGTHKSTGRWVIHIIRWNRILSSRRKFVFVIYRWLCQPPYLVTTIMQISADQWRRTLNAENGNVYIFFSFSLARLHHIQRCWMSCSCIKKRMLSLRISAYSVAIRIPYVNIFGAIDPISCLTKRSQLESNTYKSHTSAPISVSPSHSRHTYRWMRSRALHAEHHTHADECKHFSIHLAVWFVCTLCELLSIFGMDPKYSSLHSWMVLHQFWGTDVSQTSNACIILMLPFRRALCRFKDQQ